MALSFGVALQRLSEGVVGVEPYEEGFFAPIVECAYKGYGYMPVRHLGEGEIRMLRQNGVRVKILRSNGIEQMVLVWGNISDMQMTKELKQDGFFR